MPPGSEVEREGHPSTSVPLWASARCRGFGHFAPAKVCDPVSQIMACVPGGVDPAALAGREANGTCPMALREQRGPLHIITLLCVTGKREAGTGKLITSRAPTPNTLMPSAPRCVGLADLSVMAPRRGRTHCSSYSYYYIIKPLQRLHVPSSQDARPMGGITWHTHRGVCEILPDLSLPPPNAMQGL